MGDLLDELFKESVAQTGDGLSLGMSSHMMKFFSMSGPFIGVCVCVCVCVCTHVWVVVVWRRRVRKWERERGKGRETVLRANEQ